MHVIEFLDLKKKLNWPRLCESALNHTIVYPYNNLSIYNSKNVSIHTCTVCVRANYIFNIGTILFFFFYFCKDGEMLPCQSVTDSGIATVNRGILYKLCVVKKTV